MEQFEQQIHNYDYRFCVKAGLTSKTLFIKTSAEGEDDYKEKTVADKTTA